VNESTFPATVHHIALTVTDVDASRDWYRALLGADPAIDEAVPALTGHHSGFHHTIFVDGMHPARLLDSADARDTSRAAGCGP
jgi:catechol 2,3-dioxygenase-like lactoylglutathione lyase family enzyme